MKDTNEHRSPSVLQSLCAVAVLIALGLLLYAPALRGQLFGDDLLYLTHNPYVRSLSLDNLFAILDPWGDSARYVSNYAPLHLLAHAVERQVFGTHLLPHHVVNVVVHATGSVLLALFFYQLGLPRISAMLGGLLFFAHPANVEAVAWISQLKTTMALALCLAALLAHKRAPLAGLLLFSLALLSKATAAVALPVAVMILYCEWSSPETRATRRGRIAWLCGWAAALAMFAASQAASFQFANASIRAVGDGAFERLATSATIAGRYLAMAATSIGVSTLHQPEAVTRASDPRLLASIVAIAAITWRSICALRARSLECAFWAFAVVSFLPVSQAFPFLYPMADRYLYFMLPGLIGALLFVAQRVEVQIPADRRQSLRVLAISLTLSLCAGFSAHSAERARVWRSAAFVLADSARHYPDGLTTLTLRARGAIAAGNVDESMNFLRRSVEQGFRGLEQLLADRTYMAHRGNPQFEAILRDLAQYWVERLTSAPEITQIGLTSLARAHLVLGDASAARAAFERALERGGPLDDSVRRELRALKNLSAQPPESR